MQKAGFTIVEIVITITIMAILLTLAVVNVSSTQMTGRDNERKADTTALAQQMESFYTSGSNASTSTGRYPSTYITQSEANARELLRDLDTRLLLAPGANVVTDSFVAATNVTQTTTGVAPQPTISQYVYQPLTSTGALCVNETQECRRFNLYYRLEADGLIYQITSDRR